MIFVRVTESVVRIKHAMIRARVYHTVILGRVTGAKVRV